MYSASAKSILNSALQRVPSGSRYCALRCFRLAVGTPPVRRMRRIHRGLVLRSEPRLRQRRLPRTHRLLKSVHVAERLASTARNAGADAYPGIRQYPSECRTGTHARQLNARSSSSCLPRWRRPAPESHSAPSPVSAATPPQLPVRDNDNADKATTSQSPPRVLIIIQQIHQRRRIHRSGIPLASRINSAPPGPAPCGSHRVDIRLRIFHQRRRRLHRRHQLLQNLRCRRWVNIPSPAFSSRRSRSTFHAGWLAASRSFVPSSRSPQTHSTAAATPASPVCAHSQSAPTTYSSPAAA